MKKSSLLIKVCAVSLMAVLALTACGGSKKKDTKESKARTNESEQEEVEQTTTTIAQTTAIPTYSGPSENTVTISWEETQLESPTVKYVNCNEFINVRSGPGTDYDSVTRFTKDMQVIIVATTSNGWSKTQDGYYVSSELLKDLPSA